MAAYPTPLKLPRSVLFVCNHNAIRSPMAEVLTNRHARGRIFVGSVGLMPGTPDAFTLTVMSEIGEDVSDHAPRLLRDIKSEDFDLLIALTGAADQALRDRGITGAEFWPISNPAHVEGRRDQILQAYRAVRDELKTRIENRFSFE